MGTIWFSDSASNLYFIYFFSVGKAKILDWKKEYFWDPY